YASSVPLRSSTVWSSSGTSSSCAAERSESSRFLRPVTAFTAAVPSPAGVGRVVEHLEIGRRVLDLSPLVEARAADHLVADLVQAQRLLEHSRLRVHPVEDRDLAAGEALLDQPRDLGGDVARLGLLVLDLDHAHRIAVAELGPEPLLLPLRVVRDHGV